MSTTTDVSFLFDIPVEIVVELGRTQMTVRELSELQAEDVVPLDRLAGQALDLKAGGQTVARGEVFFEGDRMSLRITDLIGTPEKGGE